MINRINSQIRPLVMAARINTFWSGPADITMISVFCKVITETSASIKLMERKSFTRMLLFFSAFQIDGCHDDFVCGIGCHGDCRNESQIDRFLAHDHDGKRQDQCNV